MKGSTNWLVVLCLALLGSQEVRAQRVTPFPPRTAPSFIGIPLNGGRVHSISVHPTDSRRIVVVAEFGGLWLTSNGGDHWRHVAGLPAVFATDAAWSPDGTIIATLARDNQVDNGGGIWVSRELEFTWERPASAVPPPSDRTPSRISGRGIAYAPDDLSRVYVGTDYGLAVSSDNGSTWRHHMLETSSPVHADRLQNAVFSVAGLPGDRVVALSRTGVWLGTYRRDTGAISWRNVRPGDFTFGGGFKNVDVSPLDRDKVFIVQNYSTLLLWEVAADRWTSIPLPGGDSRGPFVRVSRASGTGDSFDIWVGSGVVLRRATCPDIACVRRLTASSWTTLGRSEGLHDDSGYLGLDGRARPVLYGSDGGLFKPTDASATRWTHAAVVSEGWNSYQISDLAGTNIPHSSPDEYRQSLYFSTQDNGFWASADNGATWPYSDCAEGTHMETRKDARADSEVTVGYSPAGCHGNRPRMSGAHFGGAREVPSFDTGGTPLPDFGGIFYVSPNRWARYRFPAGANPEVHVSDSNASRWRRHGDFPFQVAGVFGVSGPSTSPSIYSPVIGGRRTAAGADRIALLRMRDVFRGEPRSYGEADLLYLPDDGSLGIRATMFDWQAVYGVDPTDPQLILAPDVVNRVVKVSRDGGRSWETDSELTRLVTRNGTLLLYDGAYHMQVIHIAFDPYSDNILVGTRDAGVIWSPDRGRTWRSIAGTDHITYITGFFFRRGGSVVVSSYGRGLWEIDLYWRLWPFPKDRYCRRPCLVRLPPSPRPVDVDWRNKAVFLVVGGRINGVLLEGDRVEAVTVTPGSRVLQYVPEGAEIQERIPVREAKRGAGFKDLKRVLGCPFRREVLTGLIFQEARFVGLLSTRGELNEEAPVEPQIPDVPEAPYLILTTSLALPGLPVLGRDDVLQVLGRGFRAESDLSVAIDDQPVQAEMNLDQNGTLRMKLVVPEGLSYGEHTLEVVEKTPDGERVARGRFVHAVIDDFEEQQ